MYCQKCNALMPPNAVFCGKCASPMPNNPVNRINGDAPAKTLLKVMGILYLIFGGISLFRGLIGLIAIVALGFGGQQVLTIVGILAAGYSIFCGILMLMYNNRLDKAQVLLYNAIGRTALYVITILAMLIITPEMFAGILLVLSLIEAPLHILFIVGSVKNYNASK